MPPLARNMERVTCRGCGWIGIRVKPGTREDGKEEARGFGPCKDCGHDDLVSLRAERERRQLAKARMSLAEYGEGRMDDAERGRLLEMGARLKGLREGAQVPNDKEMWRCLGIMMCEVAVAPQQRPQQAKAPQSKAPAGKGAQAQT